MAPPVIIELLPITANYIDLYMVATNHTGYFIVDAVSTLCTYPTAIGIYLSIIDYKRCIIKLQQMNASHV